jgi:hypothetical protein
MELDHFLAQPPAPVHEDGFSHRVALRLYGERVRRRNWVWAACGGTALFVLALMPLGMLLQGIVLQLTAVAFSPFAPFVAGGALFLWLASQPRSMRF